MMQASPSVHLVFRLLALKVTNGGIAWPAALTQPVTVIWLLFPDVRHHTFFWPLLVTIFSGRWSNGIPVSSTLYIWVEELTRPSSTSASCNKSKYCLIVSRSSDSICTLAVASPFCRESFECRSMNHLNHPSETFHFEEFLSQWQHFPRCLWFAF